LGESTESQHQVATTFWRINGFKLQTPIFYILSLFCFLALFYFLTLSTIIFFVPVPTQHWIKLIPRGLSYKPKPRGKRKDFSLGFKPRKFIAY